jgi:hypothetical protein
VDTNRPFQFQKSGQPFIGAHNETPPVAAMRVCNPDPAPASMIPLPKCRMIRHNSGRGNSDHLGLFVLNQFPRCLGEWIVLRRSIYAFGSVEQTFDSEHDRINGTDKILVPTV